MADWTDRDEALLRQCVFECAYDFDAAATALLQRLPKQRKLALGENAITPRVVERKYMEFCHLEDGDHVDGDDGDEDVDYFAAAREPAETLKDMSTSEDVVVVVSSCDLPVLEMPLSEFDVDVMLQDIPTESAPRDSEMQWVLSYLEDPTNAVDDVVDGSHGGITLKAFAGSEAECLAQMELAFQASRERSHRNRSADNLLAPGNLPLAKEDEGDLRAPAWVAETDDNTLPECMALPQVAPVETIARAVDPILFPPPSTLHFQSSRIRHVDPGAGPCTLPPANLTDEDAVVEREIESGSDSDTASDAEDWKSARQQLKDRTSGLPPRPSDAALLQIDGRHEKADNDDVDGGDASEAKERQLMKVWKRELELQEQELSKDEPNDLTEKVRLVREEVQSLLLVAAQTAQGHDHRHSQTQKNYGQFDRRPFSDNKNPYVLNEREVSVDFPPDALVQDRVRSPQALREKGVKSSSSAAPKPPPADRSIDQAPLTSLHAASPAMALDAVKALVEKSILASVDALSEPLYHRQLSHGPHLPTLPKPYWQRIFSYSDGATGTDESLLAHVHVLAVQGLDSTDESFGTIVQLFCQLQHEGSPCTLLGLQYTVSLPAKVSLQPPPQAHADAVPVLLIALQCEPSYIDAILHSPMASFLPGNTKTLGDYLVRVPQVTATPSSSAADTPLHPIHLFSRLPAFQVYHNHLPHHHPDETTLVVLRDPAAHVLDVLCRTRARLDLVGLKLCFDASFEPHVVVSPEVAAASCHLIVALRGVDATTVVRDVLHDLPKTHVYLPHGALQARRDVVHWFGGRVVPDNAPSELVPRARPVYGLVLKPDQVVAVRVSVEAPSGIGRVFAGIAAAGYDLVGLTQVHDDDGLPCQMEIAVVKENGANAFRIAHLQSSIADGGGNVLATNTTYAPPAALSRHGLLEPPTLEGNLPPLFIDFDREQPLLAVLLPDGDSALGQSVAAAMEKLLESPSSEQLLGIKMLCPAAVDSVRDVLTSLQCVVFGSPSSATLPDTAAVAVLFRQHVEDGHFRQHFRSLTSSKVRLYTDPSVVRTLLPLLFDASEYSAPRRPSPLDLCFPPRPRCCDGDAFPGLFQTTKSTPFTSVLVVKPDDPLGVLPVVLRRLARDGFAVVSMHMTLLPSSSSPAVGSHHVSASQWLHMASRPSIVCIVRRVSCIARLHALVGPTDPDVARQTARFSLVAGYGIDIVRNGFYTSPTYDQARWDLHSVYGVGSDDDYDALARQTPAAVVGAPFTHTLRQVVPTTYVTTPRTLVETTLLVVGGSAVQDASALVAALASDGGFVVVNLCQGGLTPDQKVHCASHFAPDLLEGPWLALALERDNAVSRLSTFLATTSLFADTPAKRHMWRCSTSAKDARAALPLFFHTLYGSVHSLQPATAQADAICSSSLIN